MKFLVDADTPYSLAEILRREARDMILLMSEMC